MADFVQYRMSDGTAVFFESAESDLVELRGGTPNVADGGRLTERLHAVAEAAQQISGSLRSQLAPEEVTLEFGLKVSGEVGWWFFAKAQGEGAIKVTLRWTAGNEETGQVDQPDCSDQQWLAAELQSPKPQQQFS
jgi:Trypsin-co-occurring domain 1